MGKTTAFELQSVRVDAIILARGGSKGLRKKNIIEFCGKPLLAWTIDQCKESKYVGDVWVSSDSDEILRVAEDYGARKIKRPKELSGDHATSESGWLHAIDHIEKNYNKVTIVLAPQVTSPLRNATDFERGIEKFVSEGCDSMFSSSLAKDFFIWEKSSDGELRSSNYDFTNRVRRQEIEQQYIENGSFYIFKSDNLRRYDNRLGGKIDYVGMEIWQLFEIDDIDDARMCSVLMREFLMEDK